MYQRCLCASLRFALNVFIYVVWFGMVRSDLVRSSLVIRTHRHNDIYIIDIPNSCIMKYFIYVFALQTHSQLVSHKHIIQRRMHKLCICWRCVEFMAFVHWPKNMNCFIRCMNVSYRIQLCDRLINSYLTESSSIKLLRFLLLLVLLLSLFQRKQTVRREILMEFQ